MELKLPKISRTAKTLLFSEIIYWFAMATSFSIVITFLVSDKLSGTIVELGLLFIALYGSMSFTAYLTNTKKSLSKFKEINTSIFGMCILLVSAILVILSSNFYVVLTAFILEGIGFGIWVPSKTAILWKNTKKENRERVSGWLSGWIGFVQAIGPIAGGFLITKIGINAPFYLKGGIALVSLLVYVSLLKKT
jgi:predicted MFS family arabinose efflux permease